MHAPFMGCQKPACQEVNCAVAAIKRRSEPKISPQGGTVAQIVS